MLRSLLVIVAVLLLGVILVPAAGLAQFEESKKQACIGAGGEFKDVTDAAGNVSKACTGGGTTLQSIFKSVANIMVFIIGAVAVIMLIIGGFRYVMSGGDSAGVEGAKNTILYAVIGIVVALSAYAIVNFVLSAL